MLWQVKRLLYSKITLDVMCLIDGIIQTGIVHGEFKQRRGESLHQVKIQYL